MSAHPPRATPPVSPERLKAAKGQIEADTCFQGLRDRSSCEWGEFPFDPAGFAMTQDNKEAILIVDDFPELPARAIRYKNRLKGFFHVGPDGGIAPVPFAWSAPKTLFNVLSSFASADFIPATDLRPLRDPLEKAFGFYDDGNIGHGSFVFSLLVEANPYQPIVVLDEPRFSQFAPTEFCDASGTEESLERLLAKSERVARELRQRMKELNVRFVNMSAGETLAAVQEEWRNTCGGPPPGDGLLRAKLLTYAPIADAFFNTPGVFAAHASINATNAEDFPFDQASEAYPNRLRVGYFNALESGLDANGHGDHSVLSGTPQPQNVDIYLNSGILQQRPFRYNRTPLLQVDGFGVDTFPITYTTTSWITPLALSRFIHARYTSFGGQEMSNELIRKIRDQLVPTGCDDLPDGRCMYQDPLKHGQIEAMRHGYQSLEDVEPSHSG